MAGMVKAHNISLIDAGLSNSVQLRIIEVDFIVRQGEFKDSGFLLQIVNCKFQIAN